MASVSARWVLACFALAACAPVDGDEERVAEATSPLAEASREHWIVVLDGRPAARAWLAGGAQASRARLAEIAAQHASLRPRIEGSGATVLGEMSRVSNGFLVIATSEQARAIEALSGVQRVEPAPIVHPALASAVPVTGAYRSWAPPFGLHGDGVRIGIIDSGVDYTHADLGGSGVKADFEANDGKIIEPGTFPTARVTGGWDFAGDVYNASDPLRDVPSPDPDPLDCRPQNQGGNAGGHGTHVAGIAAGNGVLLDGTPFAGPYDQSLDPAAFRVAPGVAPRASIYALRVFGCQGSTALLPLALEHAADPDENGELDDRLDVINMSLGSAYGLESAAYREAVKNLHDLGSLLVVAAGNEGNTFFITGSPGSLTEALSVAASADNEFRSLSVDGPEAVAGDYPVVEGSFTKPIADVGPIAGQLVAAAPLRACEPLTNASAVAGQVAFITRGECPFVIKLKHAADAGAVAAVVVDDELSSAPFVMGGDQTVAIPGVLIRRVHGEHIEQHLAEGLTATLDATRYEGVGAEVFTSFSSRGPRLRDGSLKPEITAPGAAIGSADVGTGTGLRYTQGTSMACPMVAGAAALLRQARPEFGPEEVKAALIGTSVPLRDADGSYIPISRQGGGRVQIDKAADLDVIARVDGQPGEVAISFPPLASDVPVATSRTVTIDNRGDEPIAFALSSEAAHPLPGVTLTLEPESLTVGPGETATFEVTLQLDPVALGSPEPDPLTPATQFDTPRHYLNEAAGWVRLESSAVDLALPFYGVVRAASNRKSLPPVACNPDEASELVVALAGDSAHPNPAVSAFELGLIDDEHPNSANDEEIAAIDIRAIGIATDGATAGVEDATVYFGVAVAGQWSTPAQGPFSPVGVLVDIDGDSVPDRSVRVEPYTRSEPYADVLAVAVYDRTGARVGSRRFVNIAPASALDTQPYFNSVIVLPAFARDLGLGEETTAFRYAAYGDALESAATDHVTAWAAHDLMAPGIDPARLAPSPGRPLYAGGEPVRVHVESDRASASARPRLLLLHHANPVGARWEVVDLSAPREERLALEPEVAEALVPAGETVTRVITVRNDGELPIADIALSGGLSAGEVLEVAPSQGSCQGADAAIDCHLGALDPGQSATVSIELRAGDEDAELDLAATTATGCTTVASLELPVALPASVTPLDVSGGCGCRVTGAGGSSSPVGWIALAGAAAMVARRRRRDPATGS